MRIVWLEFRKLSRHLSRRENTREEKWYVILNFVFVFMRPKESRTELSAQYNPEICKTRGIARYACFFEEGVKNVTN